MQKKSKKKSGEYNPNIPLSISEREAIIQQISKCWIVPSGARDAKSILVKLRVSLSQDGGLLDLNVVDKSRYDSGQDNFYNAAVDSAVRAVRRCTPLQNLPKEKYSSWKEIELNFDPKELIY